MEWLTGLFKGMSGKDWGSILGGAADAYGAFKQGKVAEDLVDLQKQDYYEEKKRKKRTQTSLDLAAKTLAGDTKYDSPSLRLT